MKAKAKNGGVVRLLKTRYDEMLTLEQRGKLRPEAVVEYARNPRTLLHRSFEWDDTKAARRFRIEQARDLIQAYVVTIQGPSGPVNIRAFHSLPSDRLGDGGYRRIDDIIKDRALYEELVGSALKDLAAVKERYEMIKTLSPVWQAMERVRRKKAA